MSRFPFAWFYFGVFALAAVLGFISGLTASPIAGTLIPLVFALLTAGGAIYVIRGKESDSSVASLGEQRARASFLGRQFASFAVGFLIGLWVGIAAKFSPEALWGSAHPDQPAYSVMNHPDLALLAAAIDLDGRMIRSGLSRPERASIFEGLDRALRGRAMSDDEVDSLRKYMVYGISPRDREALELILRAPQAEIRRPIPMTVPPDTGEH